MLIAQISDLHVNGAGKPAYGGRVDTLACTRRAVARVNALEPQPDLVVITGDLADHGTPAAYATVRAALDTLRAPWTVLIGNHDERAAFLDAFADLPGMPRDGFVQYVVDTHPLRVIALDSTTDGAHHGSFDGDRADWLETALAAAPATPTIVALHHPPFDTGIAWMDGEGAGWAAPLRAVLARHPQVVRVICGHLHRAITATIAGIPVSVTPSVAHQVVLDLMPGLDLENRLPAFELEPPGFLLHAWSDAGLVTHVVHVDRWEQFPPITREVLEALIAARAAGRPLDKPVFE